MPRSLNDSEMEGQVELQADQYIPFPMEEVSFDFVSQVFEVIESCPQHTFQILTKRPERMLEFARDFREDSQWPVNIWAGVSVENQYWADRRIPLLCEIPSSVRFLSCEPLLKPLTLDLQDIHWVIVGGESGSKARPIEESWVLDIQNQCRDAGVAFFFKQWGGTNKKAAGALLDGRECRRLSAGDRVSFSRDPRRVVFVRNTHAGYWTTLIGKMGWAASPTRRSSQP
ncbi:MAG: DUF5131 family protein [Proteobacteria bacterium]|nr:DUF5131 family protein [Pseudomonadota bacterium]